MKIHLAVGIVLLFCSAAFGQLQDEEIRQTVLLRNIKEQCFVFGKWSTSGDTETHLTYLGNITTKTNEVFKIMTSSWYWGPTKKVTNLILVFNNKNKLLGNYYLNTECELPNIIESNKLIFKPSECTDCTYAISKVDFYEGIPDNFYLGCKRGRGNVYSFYLNY
ncbi:hypothetical protein [Snuella sedimenti]|uniref:Uncharacterized protein n=1 Tax=Snuella sedimenti TaxID=2798802 RepID=A0A8J7LSP4_9FLAO|nr:hypothetical protein [Snuella sedimenti]MBJ6368640.1 hypothetical protein [Snuella sedimenti]